MAQVDYSATVRLWIRHNGALRKAPTCQELQRLVEANQFGNEDTTWALTDMGLELMWTKAEAHKHNRRT